MWNKPNCKCFNDPFMVGEREAMVAAFGVSNGEFLRGNAAQLLNICNVAWPYLAGAGLCGMASVVAFSRCAEGEDITFETIQQAMDDIVKAGQERLISAKLQIMKVEGSG